MAAIPPIREFVDPALKALAQLGGEASNDALNAAVISQMGFTPEQLAVPHSTPNDKRTEVQYRLAWARTRLRKAGLIEPKKRGIWQLTPAGRQKLSE